MSLGQKHLIFYAERYKLIRRIIFWYDTNTFDISYHQIYTCVISYHISDTRTHTPHIFDSYDGYYDDVMILYDDYDDDDEYDVVVFIIITIRFFLGSCFCLMYITVSFAAFH